MVAVVAGTGIWLAVQKGGSGGQPSSQDSTTATTTPTTAAITTTSAAPTVTAAQLDPLLLSADQIGTIVNATGMVADPNTTEMKDPSEGTRCRTIAASERSSATKPGPTRARGYTG